MKNIKLISWILLAVLVTVSGCLGPASQPVPDNVRQLSVSGSGTVYVVPKIARINIGVRSRAEDVAQALSDNNINSNQIIKDLREFGVEPADIQTVSFNVYPEQIFPGGTEKPITNYSVENMVNVTVRDLTNLGDLLDSVVRQGANQIYGITYDLENREQAESDARQLAIENARMHAEELALSAGIQLGKVISVSTTSSGGSQPFYEGKRPMGDYAQPVPISGGQMAITMDAYLIFEIQ